MAVYKSKTPTKDGRSYYFRIKYKDLYGNIQDYHSIKFKNKKDAELEEAKYRIKIGANELNTSQITFQQIFNEYIIYKEKQIKPQSIEKIKIEFRYLESIKNIKINDFNLNHYKKLKQEIENYNFSTKYSNKPLVLLKALINYSNKYYNTSDRMNKFIEKFKNPNQIKKEMDFFTYEEFQQFTSVIHDINWKTFFDILYFLGLRQGECQALTFNDLDLKNSKISITKTLTTKLKGQKYTISSPKTKNSIRVLPIPKSVLNGLKTIKKNAMQYKDYNDNWFIFGNTFPFPETTIQKKKNDYCKLANIKQIRIHDFRHSCASLLINQGASIMLVSKYLGHSNISITLNTYSHMYKSELENITKILDNI